MTLFTCTVCFILTLSLYTAWVSRPNMTGTILSGLSGALSGYLLLELLTFLAT